MFISMNFTHVTCKDCKSTTVIEPGRPFKELNCKCNKEVSTQLINIEEYTNGESTVELIGEFENGDKEVKYPDGTLSYRIPQKTFDDKFKKNNIEDLRAEAKLKGIRGYGRMSEETLRKRLEDGES